MTLVKIKINIKTEKLIPTVIVTMKKAVHVSIVTICSVDQDLKKRVCSANFVKDVHMQILQLFQEINK